MRWGDSPRNFQGDLYDPYRILTVGKKEGRRVEKSQLHQKSKRIRFGGTRAHYYENKKETLVGWIPEGRN